MTDPIGSGAPPAISPPGAPSIPFFQSDQTRRRIVAAYWAVLILGIPFWWYTTSIERLALPRGRIHTLAESENTFKFPTDLTIDVSGTSSSINGLLPELKDALSLHSRVNKTLSWSIAASEWDDGKVRLEEQKPNSDKYTVQLDSSLTATNLANLLAKLLVPSSNDAYKLRVVQYAPRYRLAFSLLNEDASAGSGIMGWDIEAAIQQYLEPTIKQLGVLHNFTIESQVQFHAPLAFEPSKLDSPQVGHLVNDDQMKIFVNSAEWTLASSASNDPVLHFIIFVPSAARRPLHLVSSTGAVSQTNAFIVPQWGGIVVFNPTPVTPTTPHLHLTSKNLAHPFALFDTQLKALLGIQPLPQGVQYTATSPAPLSQWQVDALVRHRVLENMHGSIDTVNSIVKLVDRIKGMPVGGTVKSDIEQALDALEELQSLSHQGGNLPAMLKASARASVHASKAFFNPNMVAMLYFPTEHKYAVYTPLFAPVAVPLVVAAIREVRAWMASRRLGKAKVE